ncbi:MAG: InlB B-repeat-containing protein, partial [Christensenellales bacterium]
EENFVHVYANASFVVASLVYDEKGEHIIENGSYAAEYSSYQYLEFPIFFGNLNTRDGKGTQINADFSGANTAKMTVAGTGAQIPIFPDIVVKGNKIVYSMSAMFSNQDLSDKISVDSENKKPGIYNGRNGLDLFTPENFGEEFKFYMLYSEPGLIISYHNKAYSAETANDKIVKDRIEFVKNQTEYSLSIKDYFEMFKQHRYDFVGWQLNVVYYDQNGGRKNVNVYIYPKNFDSITLPSDLTQNDSAVNIHLYPIFVTRDISALNFKEHDELNKNLFEVKTPEDLIQLSYLVNFCERRDIAISLKANINMMGIKNFLPIGFSQSTPFCGTFNGNSYTISNLEISANMPTKSIIFSKIRPSRAEVEEAKSGGKVIYPLTTSNVFVGLFGYVDGNSSNPNIFTSVNLVDVCYAIKDDGVPYSNYVGTDVSELKNMPEIYVGGLIGDGICLNITKVLVKGRLGDGEDIADSRKRVRIGGICGNLSHSSIKECVTKFGFSSDFEDIYVGSMIGYAKTVSISDCFDWCDVNDFDNAVVKTYGQSVLVSETVQLSGSDIILMSKNMPFEKTNALSVGLNDNSAVLLGANTSVAYGYAYTNRYGIVGYFDLSRQIKFITNTAKFKMTCYDVSFGNDCSFTNCYTLLDRTNIENYLTNQTSNEITGFNGTCSKMLFTTKDSSNNKTYKYQDCVEGTLFDLVNVSTIDEMLSILQQNSQNNVWVSSADIDGTNNEPYLKNTGMSKTKFVFDGSKYIFTPDDEYFLQNAGATKTYNDETKCYDYCYEKNFFILIVSGALDASIPLLSEWNSNDNYVLGRWLGGKMQTMQNSWDYIAGNSSGVDENFWSLEGYACGENCCVLIKNYFGSLDYLDNGIIWGYVNNNFSINLNDATTLAKIKVVDFILNNNYSNVYLNYVQNDINLIYEVEIGGKTYVVSNVSAKFGEEVEISEINPLNVSNSELKQALAGKEIVGYEIKLPTKNVFVNISGRKLEYVGTNNFETKEFNTNNAENDSYSAGEKFLISLIDYKTNGSYKLLIIVREKNIKDIEYKLNFFNSRNFEGERPAYNVFVETSNGEFVVDQENGNINYFVAKYNDVLVGDGINLMPTYEKIGYTYKGWGFNLQKLTSFYSGSANFNMPDLRMSPYLAQKDENGYYYLDLYPIMFANSYEIRYYDGFELATKGEDELTLIAYHDPNPMFNQEIKLYNDGKLQAFSGYNQHFGYILSGFKFKNSTIQKFDDLSETAKDVMASEIIHLIDSGAYLFDMATLLGDGEEISADVDLKTFVKNHLAKICEQLFNQKFSNIETRNKSFAYFIPFNVDLICEYERKEYDITITLPNSNRVQMKYTVTDAETKETSPLQPLDFEWSQEAVIKVNYNDIINIYTYLYNGTRVNKIECSDSNLYSFTTFGTSAENYALNEIPNIANNQIGRIVDGNFEGISSDIEFVYDIENFETSPLEQDHDGVYIISTAEDLIEYANNVCENEYQYAKLVNNIDITGIKLNINNIPEEYVLDGQNYCINGFTNFDIDFNCIDLSSDTDISSFMFVYINNGTIKNLNFDNVCVNIQSAKLENFGLIGTNYRVIENVNILRGNIVLNNLSISDDESPAFVGAMVGINYGSIVSVSSNANIKISGNRQVTFAGLLAGVNDGQIEKAVVQGTLDTTLLTNSSYISGFVGFNNSGSVNNVVIKNCNLSANLAETETKVAGVFGFVVADSHLTIPNIKNLTSYVDFGQSSSGNAQDVVCEDNKYSEIIKVFDIFGNEDFVIENVNVQIVKISVESFVDNEELKAKIKNQINSKNLDDLNNINFALELQNKMKFNSTTFENSQQNFAFNLAILVDDAIKTDKFDVSYILDENTKIYSSSALVGSSTNSVTNEVKFSYKTKKYPQFSFNVSYTNESKFNSEEIEAIQNGIKLYINEKPFKLLFNEDGSVTILDENDKIVYVKYFDEVTIEFDLPSVAFLSSTGLTLNNNQIEESCRKYKYVYSITADDSNKAININADIERRVIQIVYDLKLAQIEDEVEKAKISFDAEFISKILVQKYGYEAELNEQNQLVVKVNPTETATGFVYYLPTLVDELDGNYVCVLSYADNGINYKFNGFVNDEDGYYYDEMFAKFKSTFPKTTTIFAEFEKVEYVVEIDNLDGACYYPNLNGYDVVSSKAQKRVKFFEDMTVPEIDRIEYSSSYIFKGYKLDDGTSEGIMVADATSETIGEETTIKNVLRPQFAKLNANYTQHKQPNEFKIVLIPVFEEVAYTLTFKDGQNEDGYEAYLYFEDSEYDANHYDQYQIEDLKISNILSGDFVLPQASKQHHSFVGYKVEGEEEIAIAFTDNQFVFEKDVLIGNKTFVAVYNIDKVNVKIEIKDSLLDLKLDYVISDLGDLATKNVDYVVDENNDILFSVDYNTTMFVLPSITLNDDDYLFNSYCISGQKYTISHVFTQNEVINIICGYKVIYQTKMGEIASSYSLFATNQTFHKVDNLSYSFYAKANEEIVLPLESEVQRTGFTLSGFKIDGEAITNLVVTKPVVVEFVYSGQTYTLSLDTEERQAKLPKSLIGEFVESYERIDDYHAQIKVVYGTRILDLKTNLPKLDSDGYTFEGYDFDQTDIITTDGDIFAIFVQNEYTIVAIDGDEQISSITKHFGESIDNAFYSNIEAICQAKAEQAGSIYRGLSLDKKYFVDFANPQTMPQLEKDYSELVVNAGHTYTLKVYCNYLSNVLITIVANENSMIKNENTQGISNFEGGYAYNADARFKIETGSVLSGTVVLPVPTTKPDSDLCFAEFVGYSTEIDGVKTMVVDKNGNLLDEFVYSGNVVLMQEFSYKTYDLNLQAKYTTIDSGDTFGFKIKAFGFSKQITFGDVVGKLPVLKLENYTFKGYYFSESSNLILASQDEQICDEFGNLLANYAQLNQLFFKKLGEEFVLKNIYAKYEAKIVDVTIKSQNTKLGLINSVTLLDGTNLAYRQVENGIVVSVPSGKDILISTTVNSVYGKFKSWIVMFDEQDVTDSSNIENANNEATMLKNVTKNYEIIASFDYVEFNIIYMVDGIRQELAPNKFNIDTAEFELPVFEKYGYNFMGWYLEEEFVNKREKINAELYSADVTLFGKLANKTAKINVYSNNIEGYNLICSVETVFGKPIETLPQLSLAGYNFVGFFHSSDGTGVLIENRSLSIFVEDIDVYCVFEQQIDG